jgi:hypothetical protein
MSEKARSDMKVIVRYTGAPMALEVLLDFCGGYSALLQELALLAEEAGFEDTASAIRNAIKE